MDASGGATDHSYHRLRVGVSAARRPKPARSSSTCPKTSVPAFAYEAGQFCTFRVWIDGQPLVRCYSMSSSPAVDAELQVTVKRTPGVWCPTG